MVRGKEETTMLVTITLILLSLHSYAEASPVSYRFGGENRQALICRPEGKGPFPAVVYNHGRIVDMEGTAGASERGYDLDGICRALAKDGFVALAPIRDSGRGDIPGHREEVSQAVDYVKTLPDVDSFRVALMGFSRGGLLTLMVGVERRDLKALLILAPAPGRGRFAEAVLRVASLNSPVLLLVEEGDRSWIREDFEMLERALQAHGKEVRAIRYDRGGGHRLFWNADYYWKDVSSFLREHLGRTPSR